MNGKIFLNMKLIFLKALECIRIWVKIHMSWLRSLFLTIIINPRVIADALYTHYINSTKALESCERLLKIIKMMDILKK